MKIGDLVVGKEYEIIPSNLLELMNINYGKRLWGMRCKYVDNNRKDGYVNVLIDDKDDFRTLYKDMLKPLNKPVEQPVFKLGDKIVCTDTYHNESHNTIIYEGEICTFKKYYQGFEDGFLFVEEYPFDMKIERFRLFQEAPKKKVEIKIHLARMI